RTDEDGALVLSEFAGAAAEMGEAVQVNPYDIEAMAAAYEQALVMTEEERRVRMRALRERILARAVHEWAKSFIDTLEGSGDRETPSSTRASSADALEDLLKELRAAPRLLLFLDYDGTIVPFARAPDLATPDAELVKLVEALASRPWTQLHVVSGRKR